MLPRIPPVTGLTWRSSKGSGLKVEAHLMEPWDLVWQHMLGSRSKRKTQSLTLIKENSQRGYLTGLSSCCAGIPRWEALSGDFDRAGWLIHPDTGAPDYVFSWWYNDGGWTKAGSSGALRFKAEWHQFAVTFDTKRILMYLDGEEIVDFPTNRGPTPFEDGGTLTYSRDRCCVPPRMFTGAIMKAL